MRDPPLPSAEVDGSGRVYVVWHDCRFRSGCSSNDIVMSTSTDGVTWTPEAVRIPIDPQNSTVDHFLPGIGADRATSGSSAHLGLGYYYYPVSNCSLSTCELTYGFVSSLDGGATLEHAQAGHRADAPDVDREHEPGLDGRRLHVDVVHRRRQGAHRVLGREASRREDVLLSDEHRVLTSGWRRRRSTSPLRRRAHGTHAQGHGPVLAAEASRGRPVLPDHEVASS